MTKIDPVAFDAKMVSFLKNRMNKTKLLYVKDTNEYISKVMGCSIGPVKDSLSRLRSKGVIDSFVKSVRYTSGIYKDRQIKFVAVKASTPSKVESIAMTPEKRAKAVEAARAMIAQRSSKKEAPKEVVKVVAAPVVVSEVKREDPFSKIKERLDSKLVPAAKDLNINKNNFPFTLELQDHPAIKDHLRSEEVPYWNAWKNDITGFGTTFSKEAYVVIVKKVLENLKQYYDLGYKTEEVISSTDMKFRTFFGAL